MEIVKKFEGLDGFAEEKLENKVKNCDFRGDFWDKLVEIVSSCLFQSFKHKKARFS